MKYSVVIATFNRADDLRETLASLSGLRPRHQWEVIVVDNNSTDATPEVVRTARSGFPVPLLYITEREQGRSPALNTGIRLAHGDIIVTTDDDVRVEPDWLDRAAAGLEEHDCDYVGGRVLPIWGGPRPSWLPNHGGRHWAVIALLDYGDEPIAFGARVPLGVNMAFRKRAFARAGLFDPGIGRKAGTLLGQEVREWCIRARAAGVFGWYVPDMALRHIIPAARLNKRYFRRWFYWRGISRAMLYQKSGFDMETPERSMPLPDARRHLLGVPRYYYRKALVTIANWAMAVSRGDSIGSFEQEIWLSFFVGILRQRFRDRKRPAAAPMIAGHSV
jgi:GT2 family glycosyltransferase